MKQEIEIIVPTKWSAVTLRQYLRLKRDLEVYKDNDEAIIAALFHHLCGMNAEYVNRLDIQTYTNIQKDLTSFFNNTELPLQRIIKIGDVQYGFEPNLSNMAYGAYVDLGRYETLQVDEKWAEVMSILYRPVTKKQKERYDIETYDGNIDETKWLDVNMEVHWGALFFFVRLQMDLLKGILKSLKEEELPASMRSILARSGELMQQSLSWPMANLKK